MAKTRFGVIGCGSAAVPVCKALARLPETELGRVQDINPDLARDLGNEYSVPFTSELDELLQDDSLDAIYIAVPHYLLAELAQRVLSANKHTLVEKPLALSVDRIDELVTLADSNHLALGVFYEMRYVSPFSQARAFIHAGAIGEIYGVRLHTLIDKKLSYWDVGYSGRSANPWRGKLAQAGGGVTLMNTSHLLDALWYMTGLEIKTVSAELDTLVAGVEVEDTLAATLRFDNNAIGNLFVGAHIRGARADERSEIYGTRGTLRIPDPYHDEPLQVYLGESWNDLPAGEWHAIPREPVAVFEQAVRAFTLAVQAGQPAPIGAPDARRVLNTVLGLYQSAREHRFVTIGV